MNARVDRLLDEIFGLPVEERSALAVALLDSLETADEAMVSDMWRAEVNRRRAALRAALVQAAPWRPMSSFEVEVPPEAETEAREAFLWYFDRSPIAADAFRGALLDAIDGLSEMPISWPNDENGTRRHRLSHFPYTVMYEVLDLNMTVFAIAHLRRRPGYWQDR